MTMVDSIRIPASFKSLWYRHRDGNDGTFYAIDSTGSLTIGTTRPEGCGCNKKWYLTIWRELVSDISYALCTAKVNVYPSRADCMDIDGLIAFEAWVGWQVRQLELSYGLVNWDICDG